MEIQNGKTGDRNNIARRPGLECHVRETRIMKGGRRDNMRSFSSNERRRLILSRALSLSLALFSCFIIVKLRDNGSAAEGIEANEAKGLSLSLVRVVLRILNA